jgi:hypothetical protein
VQGQARGRAREREKAPKIPDLSHNLIPSLSNSLLLMSPFLSLRLIYLLINFIIVSDSNRM